MSCAKTVEWIEIRFGMLRRMGPGNILHDSVADPHGKGNF